MRDKVPAIPPNHWDEWAMHKSREIVQQMEDVPHPRAQLIARIHCLLVEAMTQERDRCRARAIEIIGWHRNDYNGAQIDPILAELRRSL